MTNLPIIGYTTEAVIERMAEKPGNNFPIYGEPLPGHPDIPLVRLEDAQKAIDQLLLKQTYTYMGKDGKTVLARDLEDERDRLKERLEELEAKIENATYAASETQPTWHHRCNKIMAALGYDYGDANWMMPDEKRRLADAEADIFRLKSLLTDAKNVIKTLAATSNTDPLDLAAFLQRIYKELN